MPESSLFYLFDSLRDENFLYREINHENPKVSTKSLSY